MLAVFRADADTATGGGHVARCASLALELRRRGWCSALAARGGGAAVRFATAAFDEICDIDADGDEAADMRERWPSGCAIAVVDHYRRDTRLEAALRPWAQRILAIDDLVDRRHDCDFLLDTSLSRAADDYADLVPHHARLMIGPEFALLRPDFPAARAARLPREGAPARFRVLIMFGATDPGGESLRVAAALAASDLPIEMDLVIGPAAPSLRELERLAVRSPVPIDLSVGATDIARRMAEADLAIGNAGTSSWERCCLGLPSIVIILAENQRHVARGLAGHGAARLLGAAPLVGGEQIVAALDDLIRHADRLQAMSRSAAALCDGLGAVRVADLITRQDA